MKKDMFILALFAIQMVKPYDLTFSNNTNYQLKVKADLSLCKDRTVTLDTEGAERIKTIKMPLLCAVNKVEISPLSDKALKPIKVKFTKGFSYKINIFYDKKNKKLIYESDKL